MKSYEKESFLKSLLLFFVTIELLIGFLLYHSYNEDVGKLKQQLFLEMKNYNFTFEGDRFALDFVPADPDERLLELHESPTELYALFPLPSNANMRLKIYLERAEFDRETGAIAEAYGGYALLLSLVVLAMAFGFAHYTLRPLRQALRLLDQFIKDIIHDLNTPVSAILVNTAMLPRDNKAVQRIEKSAGSIGMLHRNLQQYLGNLPTAHETVPLHTLLNERIEFFRGLYPALAFNVSLQPCTLNADPDAMERIIDNLLSNACKYNVKNGDVSVVLSAHALRIENSSHGLREPQKLFQRFYKESERGIGIGLHIAKRLCDEQGIAVSVSQSDDLRVAFELVFSAY